MDNLPTENYVPAKISSGIEFPKEPLFDPITQGNLAYNRTHHAKSFIYKYIGLLVVLCILSLGLVLRTGFTWAGWFALFGLVSLAGYFLLGRMENTYSPEGIEITRLTYGSKVLIQKIKSDENIALARMAYQSQNIQNTITLGSNVHSNAIEMPPDPRNFPDQQLIEAKYSDPLRTKLIQWLCSIYEDDSIAIDGRITKTVLWSARGGLSVTERQHVIDILNEVSELTGDWVVKQDRNSWYINNAKYNSPGRLAVIIGV